MKPLSEVKITFPAESRSESFARSAAAAFSARFDPSVSEIGEIRTAVSEAVTNCIVHAYRGAKEKGRVELILREEPGNTLCIKVRDKGCGIADIEKAMEPLYTSAPDEERAGLGFAVMESFMDKVTVKSVLNKGTDVTMKRKILSKETDT